MEIETELAKGLEELRKNNEKRKFIQTAEVIVNLQKFDLKKNGLNLFVTLPHKVKDKKICAFLNVKNKNIETITKEEFKRYSDKAKSKKLAKQFDFFVAEASLMPSVATSFGRALGPSGKMPSPQLGILTSTDEKEIAKIVDKINHSVKIRTKEPCIKIPVGKENMKDSEIIENIMTIYNLLLKNLPRNKENIKSIVIKFTMTKPYKIHLN